MSRCVLGLQSECRHRGRQRLVRHGQWTSEVSPPCGPITVSHDTRGARAWWGARAESSFLDESDPESISVPLCLLPSQGEDMEKINAIMAGVEKKNPGKNFMKRFGDQVHGWTAARADLSDPHQAEGFREAYQIYANFFEQHL